MKEYSAVLIDDEMDGIDLLSLFLKKYIPNIKIIGTANSVGDGVNLISELKPDIVFLDIQLKEDTAFNLLDQIDFSNLEIVLVTAYEEYALKAFKYNVVDYILKPVSIEELIIAVNKTFKRIEERIIFEKSINNNVKKNHEKTSSHISIASIDKINVFRKSDIIFCKSDGRYTTFFLNNSSSVVACKNLGEFEEILNDDIFFRIHNSYIINLDYLIKINKKSGYYCEMKNGVNLPVSKRRQEDLNDFLGLRINKSL